MLCLSMPDTPRTVCEYVLCLVVCLCLVTMDTVVAMGTDSEAGSNSSHVAMATTASGNEEGGTQIEAWGACPQRCACEDRGRHVRCDDRNFTSVPRLPSSHQVELLNLSANHIKVLSNQSLVSMGSLWQLHLDRNQIQWVHPAAFHEVPRLGQLFMQHNLLGTLPPLAFHALHNLSLLDLSHNKLQALPHGLFSNTTSLTHLNLSANQFTTIPHRTFTQASHLVVLDLSYNPLTRLREKAFTGLGHLERLDLQHTRLSTLGPGSLSGLSNLRSLNLSHSQLVRLDVASLWHQVPRLVQVDMAGVSLGCDCRLVLLRRWLANHSSSPAHSPVCASPRDLQGHLVVDVAEAALICPPETRRSSTTHMQPSGGGGGAAGVSRREALLPYDPMLGWYTAATLGGMLILFIVCIGMDKLKRNCYKIRRRHRKHNKRMFYSHRVRLTEDPMVIECSPAPEPPHTSATLVVPELQVDSAPLVPQGEPDYVYLTPSKPEPAPVLSSPTVTWDECLKTEPTTKFVDRPVRAATSCDPFPLPLPLPPTQAKLLQSGEVKFNILEINPECPLHSPKLKERGGPSAVAAPGTEETAC